MSNTHKRYFCLHCQLPASACKCDEPNNLVRETALTREGFVRCSDWRARRTDKKPQTMTAKQYVRETYPRARCVRYRKNGGGGYNLVWADSREEKRLSEGKSADEAWRNARYRVKAISPSAASERQPTEELADETLATRSPESK